MKQFCAYPPPGSVSFSRQPVEHRETPTPRKGKTVTGYGRAMPTPYMVRFNGHWHRVKVACFSNSGTAYIGKPGAWLACIEWEEVTK